MNYIALKGRIEQAIQSRPLDIEAHNDLFDLCREYEKVDFTVAHCLLSKPGLLRPHDIGGIMTRFLVAKQVIPIYPSRR